MTDLAAPAEARTLRWPALALALIAGIFLITLGWHGGFREAQAFSRQFPDSFWESLTVLGDERVLLALLLPFIRRYPQTFWSIVLAALIGGLISRGLKIGLDLPRPALLLPPEQITVIGMRLGGKSFPSGHTLSVFAFAGVWIGHYGWRRFWPLLLIAGLAGFSRVAVGAHWPVDVLAASLIGIGSAWAGIHLARRWPWGLRPLPQHGMAALAILAAASLPFVDEGYPGSFVLRLSACLWGLAGFALACRQNDRQAEGEQRY